MEAVWLSVIVPSHNGQRWLSTALQSIADQKERGIEVIVIDSSTENTSLAIAESFSTQFVIRALRFRRRCYTNGCWSKTSSASQRRQFDATLTSRWVVSTRRCGIPQTGISISRSHRSATFVTIRLH
ncbi:MAG: glycosyltransferase [Alphaproteobacteria bacterium]|nr:MAG: glycosyltransferase [Alphaproteobacteria bacterium]